MRCVAIRADDQLRLLSRNDLSLNQRYPEVADALSAERCGKFALDGEVVAFEGAQTSFARLAQRGRNHVAVFYYVFDIVWLDGWTSARPAARAQAVAPERRSNFTGRSAGRLIAIATAKRCSPRRAARVGRE